MSKVESTRKYSMKTAAYCCFVGLISLCLTLLCLSAISFVSRGHHSLGFIGYFLVATWPILKVFLIIFFLHPILWLGGLPLLKEGSMAKDFYIAVGIIPMFVSPIAWTCVIYTPVEFCSPKMVFNNQPKSGSKYLRSQGLDCSAAEKMRTREATL